MRMAESWTRWYKTKLDSWPNAHYARRLVGCAAQHTRAGEQGGSPKPAAPCITKHPRMQATCQDSDCPYLPPQLPTQPTYACHACCPLPPSLQRHWMTASLTIPFRTADIGAAVPTNPPVLNRGVGPDVPAPTAPPPPPSPPPPPPSPPPGTCAPGATCCLNGVTYTSCRTDTRAGFSFTQLYKVAGGHLFVGIK